MPCAKYNFDTFILKGFCFYWLHKIHLGCFYFEGVLFLLTYGLIIVYNIRMDQDWLNLQLRLMRPLLPSRVFPQTNKFVNWPHFGRRRAKAEVDVQ